MAPSPTSDDAALARFFAKHPGLHLYELGDLAEPFRSHTRFFAATRSDGEIDAAAALYDGSDPPTLLAFAADEVERAALLELLVAVLPTLPPRLYTHLTAGIEPAFRGFASREDRGQHAKMVLREPRGGARADGAERLGPEHAAEVRAFLDAAYPGHFFHERVLEGGMAFGLRDAEGLRCFAGLHVIAPRSVAALGNVATHPESRGRGYARRCVAALVEALVEAEIPAIGLNVEAGNRPAIRLYEGLGFERVALYAEAIHARA
ncbi:MAG: GNAT family N-acetyltransferase [Polyangiaceae bacterium]